MNTQHRFMRALKALLLPLLLVQMAPAALAQNSGMQVLAAWYGQENGAKVDTIRDRKVVDYLQEAAQSGILQVPSNMNDFFRRDPFPGVPKVLAVQLRYNGVVYNIRQVEGRNLVFPGVLGVSYLPEPLATPINLRAAWYGVEGTAQASNAALDSVRKGMLNGNIHIPADMNTYFAGDPAPGKVKRVAVNLDFNGRNYDLRQIEGKALTFPGVAGVDYLQLLSASQGDVKGVFNSNFYMLKYPDLKEAFGSNADALWSHYVNFGMKEGRDPHPEISMSALRLRYAFLQTLYGSDYSKYIQHFVAANKLGAGMNANPGNTSFADKGIFSDVRLAYFDVDYYFKKNQVVCEDRSMTIPEGGARNCATPSGVVFDVTRLVEHYMTVGQARGLRAHNHPVGAAQSAHLRESMRSGDWLGINEFLVSRNGVNIAILQGNADFAVYRSGGSMAGIRNETYVGLHTGNVVSSLPNGAFITMQGDGRLCTYRGRSPSDNKGLIGCSAPARAATSFYLHLQSDNNLVIRFGDSVFNDRGYAWDFRTTKAAAPGFFGEALASIQSAVGCRR